ncbi:MAG: hypothetical protein LBI39_04460 [Puniceicoccales bacterium]|nr:hypothetical protein [Puniceicoccales bacterium]
MSLLQAVTAHFLINFVCDGQAIQNFCEKNRRSAAAEIIYDGPDLPLACLIAAVSIATLGLACVAAVIYFALAMNTWTNPIAQLAREIYAQTPTTYRPQEAPSQPQEHDVVAESVKLQEQEVVADSAKFTAPTSSFQRIEELADKFFVKRRGDWSQRQESIGETFVAIAMGIHGPFGAEMKEGKILGEAYWCCNSRKPGEQDYDINGMGLQYHLAPLYKGVGKSRHNVLHDLFGEFLGLRCGVNFRDSSKTFTKDDEELLNLFFNLVCEEAKVRMGIRAAASALKWMDGEAGSAWHAKNGGSPDEKSFLSKAVVGVCGAMIPVVLSAPQFQGRVAAVFGAGCNPVAAVVAALEAAFSENPRTDYFGDSDPFVAAFMAAAVGSGGGGDACKELIVRLVRDGLSEADARGLAIASMRLAANLRCRIVLVGDAFRAHRKELHALT